ncbi:MAG: hypothetical protein RDV48_20425 [Candidatus Eremiobacteraeota bacterium]|nr:hypothetical protein [Candidatus Eremiobacteraeota bacterium]
MNNSSVKGLSIEFLGNGSVRRIEAGPVRISLRSASPYSPSGANLYLRRRGHGIDYTALTGPAGKGRFALNGAAYTAAGSWEGLEYSVSLQLSAASPSWRWTVDLKNNGAVAAEYDVVYQQDVGLKGSTDSLVNEYYVSQYIERRVLTDARFGAVVCCRQNMREAAGHPWLLIGCANGALAGSTDGMQFYGRSFRLTGIPEGLLMPELAGEYAGESSVVALQEKPFTLNPGEEHQSVFAGTYLPDHPRATSADDLERLPALFAEFEPAAEPPDQAACDEPVRNLFNTSPFLAVDDLDSEEISRFFGTERRHEEIVDGQLLSFFHSKNAHVVLKAKELLTDRPHGHIMQARAGLAADEDILSTTAFMFGVFNSHVTQGNTNFNVLLSICATQFNQVREAGQRIFVEAGGKKYLLGIPSAFEMGVNFCRWIYKHGGGMFEVRTWTSKDAPRVNLSFRVLAGAPVNLTVTHHFDGTNTWTVEPSSAPGEYTVRPGASDMIRSRFPHARFRLLVNTHTGNLKEGADSGFPDTADYRDRLLALSIDDTDYASLSIIGEVCRHCREGRVEDPEEQFTADLEKAQAQLEDLLMHLELTGEGADVQAISEILPWFGLNALTHYLTPHGLEQFGGAAWGTRDVSQGPFDLLLGTGRYAEARRVLLTIFANQNPAGDWPQWWMFDSYFTIRAGDCHGDVWYWCMLSLSSYIRVTRDLPVLDEVLPYYHEKGPDFAEKTSLSEHMERLITMIRRSFIPGTALVPFGGGDWNDSLQPVSEEFARRLISSWTVEMNYQAFDQYRMVYEWAGSHAKAAELKAICEKIKEDFNRCLVKDGVVAGYGLVEDDGSIAVLLHPTDRTTRISYSLLPMDRGVLSELFTREQAEMHQELIESKLKGPDGARLMDRPLKYRGGIQEIFQRAESSTHFGREIGLMYIHEHIRYAESQAVTGRADAFVKALRQANPVGYRTVVPCGDIRQANCYYSSSDVAFRNRYEADERYGEVLKGSFSVRGGWRVYSSGPGIYITLIISRLLGLRHEAGKVIIDPVMPRAFDGVKAEISFMGRRVRLEYSVRKGCYTPKELVINDRQVQFSTEPGKYRSGGAVLPVEDFLSLLTDKDNTIKVSL